MEYRKLSELKKLDNNPRQIKEQDLAKLIQSIRDNQEYFEARPLILSNRTGDLVILGGNQRYEASKFLNLEEVPTHLIEGLTEEKEREIIIRDNVNNGSWDFDLLANEWDAIDLDNWGLTLWQEEIIIEEDEKEEKPQKTTNLVLKFNQDDYDFVTQKLSNIDDKHEKALLFLLKNSNS